MKRAYGWIRIPLMCMAVLTAALPVRAQDDPALVKDVLKQLNALPTVTATEDVKSYKILFDAYLALTPPPFPVGLDFNLTTIHPKMAEWNAVSGWAESNTKMAQAILKCKDKSLVGLPYGREKLDAAYVKANITADVGVDGSLRNVQFPYFSAMDTIAAYVTAETYRLMEANQSQPALDLAVAFSFVTRQFCDREFHAEKMHSIALLSDFMSNLRDVFYVYQDRISAEQYAKTALAEIPHLRPDRGRLFMPEADRIIAEALINEVFVDKSGQPDEDKLANTFAEIQAKDAPLTRFGAAKRWRMIAAIHGSSDESKNRLKLIYDDWWRRWRVDAYDDILAYDTEFKRTNEIRYAAVIYSIENIQALFQVRNRLIAEVNGTALASGLCAYFKTFNIYPDQTEKAYTQFCPKRSDVDPYDKGLAPFKYRLLSESHAVATPVGRVNIESGQALLYSRGQDHEDNRGGTHSDDGATEGDDIVLWPPVKAVSRKQGLVN